MVRSESDKTPSANWHIRVSRLLPEVRLALLNIPGVCIGEHTPDEGCKRNHYHIYYPHNLPILKEPFIKFFKTTYNLKIKGQADFACSIPTSFHDWYAYVYGGHTIIGENKCKFCDVYNPKSEAIRTDREIVFNLPEEQRPYKLLPVGSDLVVPTTDDIVGNVIYTQITPQKYATKKEPCYKRFWKDVSSEYTALPTMAVLIQYFIDWSEGAFEYQHVSAPVRYSYRQLCKKFGAEDELVAFDAQCCQRIFSRI